MTDPTARILLVGFGRIAESHVAALNAVAGLELVGAVDPGDTPARLYRGQPITVYRDVAIAITETAPDIVVIATPTWSHVRDCHEVLDLSPGGVLLVEKPLGGAVADALGLLARTRELETTLYVLYHLAFAPEVLWAIERLERGDLGHVVGFTSQFFDPYVSDPDRALGSLTSSWLDSGVNALSVLGRFITIAYVEQLVEDPQRFSTYRSRLAFSEPFGEQHYGSLLTSWECADRAQSTVLALSEGHTLVMNHTAAVGSLERNGEILELFTPDSAVARRDAHYLKLYQTLAAAGPSALDVVDTITMQRLLLTARE